MADAIGVGAVLSGRYRLEEPLGGGGFGQVYAASDLGLGRRVAVKVLTLRDEWAAGERSERQGRFRREAVAAAALSHPNVATVHDAGDHDGRPFIVMELLRGTDFGRVLLERGGLPVGDVLTYGAQICAGLQHAHEHGLVHRDIKPENLMLLPDGVVKILDFGLVTQRDATVTRYTDPHAVMGSPAYFSPEQARGHEVTGRSDLYSVGCVLYALLAEGPPFSSSTYVGYAYLHVHETPEPLGNRRPDVPGDLARLVHEMLAKDPAERPASAGEVAARLRAMAHPAAAAAVPVPRSPTALDQGARHLVWTLLEEGEGLLRGGRFAEADRRYWQALQQISRQGADREPASFAAQFGRARALQGLNGEAAVVRRLRQLTEETSAALGSGHPLARCVASYAAERPEPQG
ncbi:serine/threonine-protein kinase [Actinacidiphila acidipaludis]|uniref:non-specific serine/threonine protein kinase n=1 Tax=Actinacidiphila acidipaludis TaxID=2873382 RepID=A0ABS7Q7E6_9ACTN|nr:serine/threonine-protein kinase [Streptomyces acidipaludis]MBY8878644.1 serine/threonine protein kinase [Streptomyces acidipaludis]